MFTIILWLVLLIIVGFVFFLTDIDLKEASKYFANKFACGSTIQGEDEIVIQGDVKDELFDILPEKWKSVRFFELLTDLGHNWKTFN